MNKNDLVNAVKEKLEITKKEATLIVDSTFEAITEGLANGEDVSLMGFGSWRVKERAERIARNPQTGEEIVVPKRNAVSFKPGKQLKDIVKGS